MNPRDFCTKNVIVKVGVRVKVSVNVFVFVAQRLTFGRACFRSGELMRASFFSRLLAAFVFVAQRFVFVKVRVKVKVKVRVIVTILLPKLYPSFTHTPESLLSKPRVWLGAA